MKLKKIKTQVGVFQTHLFYYRNLTYAQMIIQHQIQIMKIIIALMITMLFTSCQEEYIDITEPDKNTSFTANDTVAELILRVTMKDGSFDNFIDNCSAISIKFPYSVHIRSENISIRSMEDIEDLEEEYSESRNSILINYPVTVIHSDYTESVLSNRGELQKIQNECSTDVEDEDIECIDFVYPIELSIYNTEFQKPDFVIAGSDKDLHGILKNANDLIVEITYPISVELWDESRINIHNNKELENEIMNAIGRCDEDDDEDDDDNEESNDNHYQKIEMLTQAAWKITHFSDTTDETSAFTSFLIDFKPDSIIQAVSDSETFYGTWEPDFYSSMKTIEIEFDSDEEPLVWLNDEWEISVLNNDIISMQAESDSDGILKKLNLSKAD